MNFRTLVSKITLDKIIAVVTTILVIAYLFISFLKTFDLNKGIDEINSMVNSLKVAELYNYLDSHSNYYYKIEGSTYCITKDELIKSGEISNKFISNMETTIEVTFKDGNFILIYNKDCIAS